MTVRCSISDTTSTDDGALAMDNEFQIYDPNAIDTSFLGSLADVENNGTDVCQSNPDGGVIPAGGTLVQSIEFWSGEGGLSSDAMGATITPVLTISGNDTDTGPGNQPNP
jgi:hypothetical protein